MIPRVKHLSLTVVLGFLVILTSTKIQAQELKYGYTNIGNLLEVMPETKAAEDSLKAYSDSLTVVGQAKEKAFQEAYVKLAQEYQGGTLTALEFETRKGALAKQQQELQAFKQASQSLGAKRRDDLLNPILDKILTAISEVAKENGYMMIFDTSSGAMLFAKESDDITDMIRTKLGI